MSAGARVAGVIAAYNAAEMIAAIVTETGRHLDLVIVADDGSTDGTGAVAAAAGAVVIRLGSNRGKGAALRALFAEGRRRGCEAVVAVDADGQHDPGDIPAFLRLHREHPGAIITGSRFGSPERVPRHRLNSMTVARFFVSLAANQFVEDSQCGFRVYPLAVAESMGLLKDGYVTETEILMKAGDSGRRCRCTRVSPRFTLKDWPAPPAIPAPGPKPRRIASRPPRPTDWEPVQSTSTPVRCPMFCTRSSPSRLQWTATGPRRAKSGRTR